MAKASFWKGRTLRNISAAEERVLLVSWTLDMPPILAFQQFIKPCTRSRPTALSPLADQLRHTVQDERVVQCYSWCCGMTSNQTCPAADEGVLTVVNKPMDGGVGGELCGSVFFIARMSQCEIDGDV
jgi:hypothetical protein